MSFETHHPTVEEVISALHYTPGYKDGIKLAVKLAIVSGSLDVHEQNVKVLLTPFKIEKGVLEDVVDAVGNILYEHYVSCHFPEHLREQVAEFVTSPEYEKACKTWRIHGRDNKYLIRLYAAWAEAKNYQI